MKSHHWQDVAWKAMAEVSKYRLLCIELLKPQANYSLWKELEAATKCPDALQRHRSERGIAVQRGRFLRALRAKRGRMEHARRRGRRAERCDEGGHPLGSD